MLFLHKCGFCMVQGENICAMRGKNVRKSISARCMFFINSKFRVTYLEISSYLSRNFELLISKYRLTNSKFRLSNSSYLSRNFDLVTRNFDLLTRNFDLLTRNFDLYCTTFIGYRWKQGLNSRYSLSCLAVAHWQSTYRMYLTEQFNRVKLSTHTEHILHFFVEGGGV
jgi:hypothetical protein